MKTSLVMMAMMVMCISHVHGFDFAKKIGSIGKNPMIGPVMSMIPAACKKEINSMGEKFNTVYDWIKKTQCPKCGPVTGTALLTLEPWGRQAWDNWITWLSKNNFDIDKVCPKHIDRKKMWTYYEMMKKDCIIGLGELTGHKDICNAKDADFAKTSKCIEDKFNQIFNQIISTGPPMGCLAYGMERCNSKNLGFYVQHFGEDMKNNPKIHEGFNGFVKIAQFFDGGCKGR